MRRMLLVGASALLPACLLFTSLDNTTNGGDPPANEAGSDTSAPANDAATGDGGASDAPVDSGIPATDGGFCLQDAGAGQVFCTEFAGATVSEGWSGLAGGVGSLDLDQGNLVAKVPVLSQYETGKHVYRTIDGAFSTLSCSFAFRRDVLGEEDISIAEFLVETAGEDYLLVLYTLPTTGRLLVQRYPEDGGNGVGEETPADIATPVGEWHRATVEMATTELRVYLDNQLAATIANTIPSAELRTTFRLGIPQVDGDNTMPWELRFDDVRCIQTP